MSCNKIALDFKKKKKKKDFYLGPYSQKHGKNRKRNGKIPNLTKTNKKKKKKTIFIWL